MHVVLVEPAFPKNQREFLRGLLSTGARVSAISERPADALPSELREGLFQFERVRSVVDDEEQSYLVVRTRSASKWGGVHIRMYLTMECRTALVPRRTA